MPFGQPSAKLCRDCQVSGTCTGMCASSTPSAGTATNAYTHQMAHSGRPGRQQLARTLQVSCLHGDSLNTSLSSSGSHAHCFLHRAIWQHVAQSWDGEFLLAANSHFMALRKQDGCLEMNPTNRTRVWHWLTEVDFLEALVAHASFFCDAGKGSCWGFDTCNSMKLTTYQVPYPPSKALNPCPLNMRANEVSKNHRLVYSLMKTILNPAERA